MSTNTIKQMVKDGTIKRADALKVRFEDLHVEPGFNERTEGPELEASIDELAEYILSGGVVPPLEIRPRADGGVWIVDGHRRQRAFGKAIARGATIEWIEVRAFVGNDADRIARIVSSNGSRELTQLEKSRVYKKLAAFGLEPTEIARMVGKTRSHVEQLLVLATADHDVRALIESGAVSATTAVDAVRKHGDQAGAFLSTQADKAKAAGRGKVTAGTITGKPLPRKVVAELVTGVEAFAGTLSPKAHETLATLNLSESRTVEVDAVALMRLVECANDVAQAREKQEKKAREQLLKAAQTEMAA